MTGRPFFTDTCRSCGAALGGEFCTECGQGHRHDRLRVQDMVSDVVDSVINLDSRVIQTVIGLSLRPGQTARDYVNGRRIPYVTPLRYAIGTCALWWLAVSLQFEPSAASEVPPFIVRYGQIINLLSIPVLVPFVQVVFLRSMYTYAEHFCFLLYTIGHLFLWRMGLALAALIPGTSSTFLEAVDFLFFVSYTGWALWGFHHGRTDNLPIRIVAALLAILIGSNLISGAVILLASATS
jgi:Protein of unknown function (DUF3667)